MYISTKDWKAYINRLSKLNRTAAALVQKYIQQHGFADTKALIEYSYAVVQKYGQGSAALSAAMYDTVAEMSGKFYPPAEMAAIADYGEVAKTVNGVLKTSQNVEEMAGAVSRLVKQAGADTMVQNAYRDRPARKYGKKRNTGAQIAWVPMGDTCAFCLSLASLGWQNQTKGGADNHAEHIHSNCDCTYAVRFDESSGVEGYDPEEYRKQINEALEEQGLDDFQSYYHGQMNSDVINAVRRQNYARDKEEINAQKRDAYEKRQELNSSAAEESDVS